MSYLADDAAAIKARLEELAAEKRLALTGSSAEEKKAEDIAQDWYAVHTDGC